MANRKSSITAEMKLAGIQKFKSELGSVGVAAKKAGKEIASVRPPDITLTPAYQYIEARKRGEKMLTAMTKAEADKRVKIEEQAAARSEKAMRTVVGGLQIKKLTGPEINRVGGFGRFDHLSGGMYAGGTGRSGRGGGGGGGGSGGRFGGAGAGAGNVGMTYNFIQDYIQGGGLRGVANNIPQMLTAITESSGMRTLLMGTVAAGAVLGVGKAAYDLYQSTGDRSDKNAFKRYGVNSAEARKRQQQREWEQGNSAAAMRGENASERQSRYSGVIESELATKGRQADFASNEREAQAEIRRIRIDAIEDPGQRAAAQAEEEKRMMDERLAGSRSQAIETMRVAAAEQAAAEARYKSIKDELESQTNAAKTQDEILRRIELQKELVGLQVRLNESRSRAEGAGRGLQDIANQEKLNKLNKQAIDERTAAEEKARVKSREATEEEFRLEDSRRVFAEKMNRQVEEGEKKGIRDKEESRLAEQESMSRMSPRKLEKYQRQKRVDEEKKRLMELGYDPAKAASMAERGEMLNEKAKDSEAHPGRIRGAGYGGKERSKTRMGFYETDGLAGLGAMQPDADPMVKVATPNERQRIGGAGRNKGKINARESESQSGASSDMARLIASNERIEKAIRETDTSKRERSKPLSTTAR